MASTRNKNSVGDYKMEQQQNKDVCGYSEYGHSAYGHPTTTYFAGDGLIMGRIAPVNLSNNSVDIESQLYGIGSTNLVKPKPDVVAEIKGVKSLDIIDRLPVYVPPDFVLERGNRPYQI
jgi:hypothetical protein